ncbi:MAG: T9SS type A sorting domain-containing protein [Ignavibacteria bacterium]|nr:T9SS type A sorting domain-containing protein [Ignavibacteria bacterium]
MKKITLFALLAVLTQFMSLNIFSQWIEWEKRILYSYYTAGYSIKQTMDGNFVIAGERNTGGIVTKINMNGDTLWNSSSNGTGYSFAEDNSGNIYTIYWDFFTKLDMYENRLWYKTLTEPGYDQVRLSNIIKSNDNKLVSVGYINGNGFGRGYMSKFDTSGQLMWSQINQSQNNSNGFSSIKQLTDNTYILIGSSRVNNNYYQYLVKKDENGNTLWERLIGENNSYFKRGYSVFQTNDKGYMIYGSIVYANYNSALLITKTDSTGNMQWQKKHGDTLRAYDIYYGESVIKDNVTNLYIAAISYSNGLIPDTSGFILGAFDSLGNKKWENSLYDDTLAAYCYGVVSCNDSSYIICGTSFGPILPNSLDSPHYLYLAKTKKINPIGINITSSEIPKRFTLHQNYPNPFNPVTKINFELPKSSGIEFNVYDILGRKVYTAYYNKPAGTYEFDFDASGFASGIYFYSFKAGEYYDTKKMIILK